MWECLDCQFTGSKEAAIQHCDDEGHTVQGPPQPNVTEVPAKMCRLRIEIKIKDSEIRTPTTLPSQLRELADDIERRGLSSATMDRQKIKNTDGDTIGHFIVFAHE